MPTKILQNKRVPLVQASFTIINQDNRTIYDNVGAVNISGASRSSNYNICALVQSTPTTPYAIIIHANDCTPNSTNTRYYGACWRESGSGKLAICEFFNNSTFASAVIRSSKYSSPTALSANYVSVSNILWYAEWFKLSDDGTNRTIALSTDGINWKNFHSISRTDYITPDQVGFCINPYNLSTYISFDNFETISG